MVSLLALPATVESDANALGTYNINDRGSDRGSGYWSTNTILRHCDRVFATWQCYDPNIGEYSVWVGAKQLSTNTWLSRLKLPVPAPYGNDNHGGASIIADRFGYIHLLYGSHNTKCPLLEAVSVNPWDVASFRAPVVVPTTPAWPSAQTTYSSVVRDRFGRLHLLVRHRNPSSEDWTLQYRRGFTTSAGTTTWTNPIVLARTGITGYALYHGAIATSGVQRLHVAFQMYSSALGAAHSWGYLRSDDGGTTWRDWHGVPITAPLDTTPANATRLVQSDSSIDVRIGNIATDTQGSPWVSVCYIAQAASSGQSGYDTQLWRLTAGQWSSVSLSPLVSALGSTLRVAMASITFDDQGVLYVAAEVVDENDGTTDSWFAGRSKEVVLLISSDNGQTFQVYPVSPVNVQRAHWLANIERATSSTLVPVPSLQYTDGVVNSNGSTVSPTDVILVPFYKY